MAKCDCCGKGVTFGIKVSHSHRTCKQSLEAQRKKSESCG